LKFDLEHQRAIKKKEKEEATLAWIGKSVSMTETWTSATMVGIWTTATLADIGYYGRNLNIGNFGQKRLLWLKFSQLWAWNLLEHIFFSTRENWVGGICG
jgi:hypothetical protein